MFLNIKELKDGLPHGQGTMTFQDGSKYEGEFKDEIDMEGTETFVNGDIYEGEFKYGQLNGQGPITHTDGRICRVQRCTYNGQGILTADNADMREN